MDSTVIPKTEVINDQLSKRPASPTGASVTISNEVEANGDADHEDAPVAKKARIEEGNNLRSTERTRGVAPIKSEYIINPGNASSLVSMTDDDAAEAKPQSTHVEGRDSRGIQDGDSVRGRKFTKAEKKARTGQNKARKFGKFGEYAALCRSRGLVNEFSTECCSFGDQCRQGHDIRKYMENRENLNEGVCPIWELRGKCPAGWKCKWIRSHMKEVEVPLPESDPIGTRKELQLVEDEEKFNNFITNQGSLDGVKNEVSYDQKKALLSRKLPYEKSEAYLKLLTEEQEGQQEDRNGKSLMEVEDKAAEVDFDTNNEIGDNSMDDTDKRRDNNAAYKETAFRPSEKRPLYIAANTPLLAPLTTTGNLPFRRLCTTFGAAVTYSEMAMSIPLIKGEKGEWALIRAHNSEKNFGAQISAKKPWEAFKATEVLADYCPSLSLIDMNSGCPIDLVYRSGGGSALLEQGSKLSKMMRGMNYVSGEIPITVKLRTGCSDKHPTAKKIIRRLIDEGDVAAITLHGRSRQQRYSREADWGYIAECSSLVERMKMDKESAMDTSEDDKEKAETRRLVPYFIGNGDCYSYEDYYNSIEKCHVDSVLIARGALIKPWIFEEIHAKQYLDKSATERLSYIEQYAKYGLEHWGSDEMGVNNTRRFLCEFLSFTYRYVPVGLLEVLPPRLQDRPPRFRGRNELETLLASDNYKDWIKISEMFLGKVSADFHFIPKHKSNSYDSVSAEG